MIFGILLPETVSSVFRQTRSDVTALRRSLSVRSVSSLCRFRSFAPQSASTSGYDLNFFKSCLPRKEVIQPHLPIRLPCYDFTPVIGHTVASALPKVKLPASGATNSHGVTGGVYKARERIHRSNADLRLLAIPTSWSRVADSNPD